MPSTARLLILLNRLIHNFCGFLFWLSSLFGVVGFDEAVQAVGVHPKSLSRKRSKPSPYDLIVKC